MKKSSGIKFALALMLSASTLISASSLSAMSAVGNVNVTKGTPTVDGKLDDAAWKDAAVIKVDSSTAKPWAGEIPADFTSTVKFLWDDTALYACGTIKDSTFKASDEGGYSGDAFQISIDAGQVFYGTDASRAIFYSFGCSSGKNSIQRQESSNNAVVFDGEGVTIKTAKTSDGWSFELAMPWDMLKEDVKLKANKTIAPAEGFKLNAMFCYLDRNTEGTLVTAFGTTLSDENTAYDWGPNDHGVTLTLAAAPAVAEPTVPNAPQTSDAALTAVIAAVVSAAAIIVVKKKF